MQALLTSLTSAKVKTTIHTLVLCALAVFTFPVVTYAATMPSEVLAAIEANYPDGLPAYMTPEEKQWLTGCGI